MAWVVAPRAVVEGQHDLFRLEEIVGLVLLHAKARTARRVDLDRARDTERVGISWAVGHFGGGRRGAKLRLLCNGCSVERQR